MVLIMSKNVLGLLVVSIISVSLASCKKKIEETNSSRPAKVNSICDSVKVISINDKFCVERKQTDYIEMNLLTKKDSMEIESLTGRKIIGAIDTTLLTSSERKSLGFYLNHERYFVKRSVDIAFDYNLSGYFSVIHFFYDDGLNCHYDCPDMFVWFSDNEAEKIRKHISKIKEGDSIIIEKGDTIIRTISKRPGLHASLKGKCLGSCDGYTTTLFLYLRMHGLVIHNHHQYFCQTHMTPGIYETTWIMQNERKKNRK